MKTHRFAALIASTSLFACAGPETSDGGTSQAAATETEAEGSCSPVAAPGDACDGRGEVCRLTRGDWACGPKAKDGESCVRDSDCGAPDSRCTEFETKTFPRPIGAMSVGICAARVYGTSGNLDRGCLDECQNMSESDCREYCLGRR